MLLYAAGESITVASFFAESYALTERLSICRNLDDPICHRIHLHISLPFPNTSSTGHDIDEQNVHPFSRQASAILLRLDHACGCNADSYLHGTRPDLRHIVVQPVLPRGAGPLRKSPGGRIHGGHLVGRTAPDIGGRPDGPLRHPHRIAHHRIVAGSDLCFHVAGERHLVPFAGLLLPAFSGSGIDGIAGSQHHGHVV